MMEVDIYEVLRTVVNSDRTGVYLLVDDWYYRLDSTLDGNLVYLGHRWNGYNIESDIAVSTGNLNEEFLRFEEDFGVELPDCFYEWNVEDKVK